MIHFSVDDTIEIFHYLVKNNCKSVFENPVLSYFKRLNEEYGFIVSMYCFYEKDGFNLPMCSDKYKKEFEENADWLKFGFHSLTDASKYENYDTDKFREELIRTVDALKSIVSEAAITYDIRIHFGQATTECIKAMKACYDNFNVLYGVDDERIVYYLSEEENSRYLKTGEFYDENIGITIKNCERRLECNTNFVENLKRINNNKINSFFTHESRVGDEKIINYIRLLSETGQAFV